MKMSDIPQLIHCSHLGTELDFDYIIPFLKRMEKDYGIDLNPEFQRGHVWEAHHKSRFIEHLLKGGHVPPLRFNSPEFGGHPRWRDCNLPETVVLVDGKQRLTAALEFMEGKVSAFGCYLKDFEDQDLVLRHLRLSYTVNKLQTREELLRWYLEMNEGAIAHSEAELLRVRKLLEKEQHDTIRNF